MAGYQSIHSGQTIDSAITEVENTSNSVTARKSGAGAPTSSTVGRVGDFYTDTSPGGKLYRCTAASGGVYTWVDVGGGVLIDDTLSVQGAAADAKAVGDALAFIANFKDITGAGLHNSIYRGKYLGSALTSAQSAAIRAGTFDDLWVGDYWTIGGVNYRIADFDYFLHSGDTELTTHHAVITTDTSLYSAQMCTTNTTAGGYVGSDMWTSNLNSAKSTITTAFGSNHILSHREILSNAVSNGSSSGWAWYDSQIDLMSEAMVYGHPAWGAHHGYETGANKTQLALFQARPDLITTRAWYWLRDVFSAAGFCLVGYYGHAHAGGASGSCGVRPYFLIY